MRGVPGPPPHGRRGNGTPHAMTRLVKAKPVKGGPMGQFYVARTVQGDSKQRSASPANDGYVYCIAPSIWWRSGPLPSSTVRRLSTARTDTAREISAGLNWLGHPGRGQKVVTK